MFKQDLDSGSVDFKPAAAVALPSKLPTRVSADTAYCLLNRFKPPRPDASKSEKVLRDYGQRKNVSFCVLNNNNNNNNCQG